MKGNTMGFEFVCEDDALSTGDKKTFKINDQKILIIKTNSGVFATQAKCPHLGAPLVKGDLLDDDTLQCKFHRAEFNLKTGKAEQWACFPPGIQALNFFRGEKNLVTYETKIEDGKILVSI